MERIHKRLIDNQLNAAESTDDDGNSTFADPDYAEEGKEEEDEDTAVEKTVASTVEQRVEESAVAMTPPQPTLPLTSLQKLDVAYGTAFHHTDGT